MIQYWFEKHRELRKTRDDEGFDGFTLIELLIVIVVLGILAATVIFALGGVTGSSAQASCNSDAKSVEVGVEAYKAFPGNGNQFPGASSIAHGSAVAANAVQSNTALTGSSNGGPFLRTYPPGNDHYYVANDASGGVWVYDSNSHAWANYDSTTNPCNSIT